MTQKAYRSKFSDLIERAVGTAESFSLENRLLNGACLFLFAMLFLFIPINIFLGLYTLTVIFSLCLPLLIYIYYQSRFKKKIGGSVEFMAISMIILLCVNFINNDGLTGPTLLYFFLVTSLTTTVSTSKQQGVWVVILLLTGGGLLLFEFYYPEYISYTYSDQGSRIFDIIASFLISMIIIFFNTRFILQNYIREKESSILKSRDLEIQKIELEKLNKEKDKLFSIISHDFRSPLAALQSTLELMNSEMLSKDEEKKLTNQTLSQLKITSSMLDNILIWSKTQLSQSDANLVRLNFKNELEKSIDTLQANLANKRIGIHTKVPDNLFVSADIEMLQIILRNLISNAIKFSHEGSQIRISAYPNDKKAIIVIQDEGVGIPDYLQKELFTFEAKSSYGTNNEKGIGLGLFLTKEFVHVQNGSISFKSAEGEGTVFEISLPLSA